MQTSLKPAQAEARHLYETIYCARGEMENRIKECQLDLFADRTSRQPCEPTKCACDSPPVREVHRVAVQQGAKPRRATIPGHQARRSRRRCCFFAAPSPPSSRRKRRVRTALRSWTGRVGLKRLDDTLPIIGAVCEGASQDILVTA